MFGFATNYKNKLHDKLDHEERDLRSKIILSKLPDEIKNLFLITAGLSKQFVNIYSQDSYQELAILDSDYVEVDNYQALYLILLSYHIYSFSLQYKNSPDISEKFSIGLDKILIKFGNVTQGDQVIIPMLNQAMEKEKEFKGNTMEVLALCYFQILKLVINPNKFNEIFEKINNSPINRMLIQSSVMIYFGEYAKAVRKILGLSETIEK